MGAETVCMQVAWTTKSRTTNRGAEQKASAMQRLELTKAVQVSARTATWPNGHLVIASEDSGGRWLQLATIGAHLHSKLGKCICNDREPHHCLLLSLSLSLLAQLPAQGIA